MNRSEFMGVKPFVAKQSEWFSSLPESGSPMLASIARQITQIAVESGGNAPDIYEIKKSQYDLLHRESPESVEPGGVRILDTIVRAEP